MAEMYQSQRQLQTTVLAPQLRQSLKILQSPAIELRTAILEELETNPALEELPENSISIDDRNYPQKVENDKWWERVKDDLYATRSEPKQIYTDEQARRRKHFLDSFVAEKSLQTHLLEQVALNGIADADKKILQYLIGNLDDDGFLTSPIEEIARTLDAHCADVQRACFVLQTFDPVGVGCKNRQESLLVQLRVQHPDKILASSIIETCYQDLLKRKIHDIAKKLSRTAHEVQEAIGIIATLDPSPGRRYGENHNHIVVPDAVVFKDDEKWQVVMNGDYVPKLRLNDMYKSWLSKDSLSAGEKEYIREKMKSGRFLMSAIEQRQQTIERIIRELLHLQGEFFERGREYLQPMNMRVLAERLGVHETTISRAVANKYVKTPHGVYALKYFFSTGYQTDTGDVIANKTVKNRIVQMVAEEDGTKPLSDQAIVQQLAKANIHVARRTIAKYREELGILPTHMRKHFLK